MNTYHKYRICNFVRKWVKDHYFDFEDEPDLNKSFEMFVKMVSENPNDKSLGNTLATALDKGVRITKSILVYLLYIYLFLFCFVCVCNPNLGKSQ
jgi:hypothetical protein